MSGIVAIVGRPNVGKSTLFNRLIERREAIVDALSGVTRDRHYGKCHWNGKEFSVIDTGGYVVGSDDIFEQEIDKQVLLAIGEADVIIFMVDISTGVSPLDEEVMNLLRRSEKPVFTTVNKIDSSTHQNYATEFYSLGIETYFPISGMNGSGTGELLDAIVKVLPENHPVEEGSFPRFAVVGRPNAGKSSFINVLIGEERFITTDIPGTTRDSSDLFYNKFGFEFYLVDTAGIRKKSRVKENIEFYSVMRSVRAIEHSDVCLLVIDATRGFEGQDDSIFWLIQRNRKGVVILVNKWDLVDKNANSTRVFEQKIRQEIDPFTDVPILFVSALERQRILKSLEKAIEVHKNRSRRIPTRKLNDIMLPIIEKQPPPSYKGKYIKIKFCTQLPTPTPMFAFFCNLPQYVKESYKRFIENHLRKHFNLNGTPVEVFFRKK